MITFCFEARYCDHDSGGRCDIVVAPNREMAIKLAAHQILCDNCWDEERERFTFYSSLNDWYNSEMEILHEWTDLEGRACPNCTAHNHFDTGVLEGIGSVFECGTCHYQWVPLGKKISSETIAAHASDLAETLAFEANMFTKEDAA